MIHIKIKAQGESDLPPFTSIFDYPTKTDEEIFTNSIIMIKEKLNRNLKININETILAFSALIVSELRNGKSIEQIQKNASCLLTPENVMIGVPETLQKIYFEIRLDNNSIQHLILSTPIPIFDNFLKSS